MTKSLLLISIIIFSFEALPQTQQFFDSPFGGGGGFTPGWVFNNVSSLNTMLSRSSMPKVSSSGLFTTGGGGFFYIGFIPGLRIGGMGYGGSTSSKSTLLSVPENNSNAFNVETDYSVGGGGVTIEYTLPFIKSVGVSIGAMIGGGNITVELYRNGQNHNWGDIFNNAAGTIFNDESHKTLTNNYWILSPTLNIDIPFYRFLCFRAGAGYNFTLGEEWKLDNNQSINNVPSDFNGRNFFIQTGIFVGFFSF